MPEFPVSVILNAVNNTKTALNEVKGDVEGMSKSFSGLESVVQGAIGALSAYAGTKGLMGMVRESVEANRMLVQSRFYLKGMGGDVEANISTLRKWGSEIQRDIGINDEFAVLVASRLAPRMKDLNKIQSYATIILKGHRLGILDAESASIMLMRAAEGNSRAMLWLAYHLGITVHEFESMDSIMAKIQQRMEGLTEQLLPFDTAMAKLREEFEDFLEEAGTPIANVFATFLNAILSLMDKFPILGEIIKATAVIISGALAGLGFGLALGTILKILGVSAMAFGPWAMIITGAIFGVIYAVQVLDKYWEEYKETIIIVGATVIAILTAVGLFMGSWVIIIAGILALVVLAFITMKDQIFEVFEKFKIGWDEYWMGIYLILEEIWNKITDFIKSKIEWVNEQVNNLKNSISKIKEATLNIPSTVGGMIKGALPGKQMGGYIPETGPYFLHRGEYVVPASKGGGISLTITGNTFLDEESAVRMGDLIIKVLQRQIRI